ncbi:2OG-Fe dioxygenase family protein [Pseudomonas fulva]|uniref:2OG-Fe dioxygenase family protein n=1 Tax=Pseudomonas fulva TaxID=47880 RepID=UPI003D038B44
MLTLKRNIDDALRLNKTVNVLGKDFALNGGFGHFVAFSKSWETMGVDKYYGQADKGTRYRRYSDFDFNPATGELQQLEHRAYEQSEAHNQYVGGMRRHFDDVSSDVFNSPVLRALIKLDFDVYKAVLPEELHNVPWQCQVHQIRIEVKPGEQIEITPEGIHCDGYPFSGVHFWGRHNIEGATSKVYDKQSNVIDSGTYQEILNTTYFLDRELQHYVTPATNPSESEMGYRQIIAISFSRPGTEHDIVK